MNRIIYLSTCAVAGAGLISGCATVPKKAGFNEVQRLVSARSHYLVQWDEHTTDDQAVAAAIAKMLARPLTVDQAVQIALLNNRRLQATFEDLGIAQADLVQAGLLKNPVFFASARFPDRAPRGTDTEFSVTQDFLDLLILPMRKRIAAEQFQGAKLSVANDCLELAAKVKEAYYTFQGREQLLRRLDLIVEINRAAAELAQRQHQAGTLNELGAVSQQAIYDESRVQLAQTESQLILDRELLNRLLGLSEVQTHWIISPELPAIPAREMSVEHLESLAVRQRLDLAVAHAQLITLSHILGITKDNRYLTNIDIGVDTEHGTDGQQITGPELSLQIPIFDQGQARVAKIKAQFLQARQRFQAMQIDVQSEVRQGRDRMLAARKLAGSLKELLPERIRILNLTLQQYNGMLKGPYDLLLAKQSEVATEQAYIEARRDYWIARAELERAVGGRLSFPPGRAAPAATEPSPANEGTTEPAHKHHSMKSMPGMPGMQMDGMDMSQMKGTQK